MAPRAAIQSRPPALVSTQGAPDSASTAAVEPHAAPQPPPTPPLLAESSAPSGPSQSSPAIESCPHEDLSRDIDPLCCPISEVSSAELGPLQDDGQAVSADFRLEHVLATSNAQSILGPFCSCSSTFGCFASAEQLAVLLLLSRVPPHWLVRLTLLWAEGIDDGPSHPQ